MSTPSVDYPNHIHHTPTTMNDAPPGCGNEYGQHHHQQHFPTDYNSPLSRSSPPPHPPLPGIIAFPSRRSGASAAAVRGDAVVRAPLAPPPDAALVGVGGGIGDEKRERMMLSLAASSSSLAYASAAATFARSEEEAFRKRAAARGLAARRAAEAALIRAADGSAVLRAERRAASSAADEESKSSSGSSSSASASASAGEGDSYDGDRDADFFRGRRRRRSRLSLTAYERRILLENSSSSPPPPNAAASSSSPQKRAVSLLAPSVPRVSPSDVTVGEILGRGGFSDVYDVRRLGERARSSVAAAAALAAAAQVLNEDEEEGQEEEEDDVLREEKDEDRKEEEEEEDSSSDLSDNEDVAFAAAAAAAASIAANASFPAATTRGGHQQQQGRRNRSSSFAAERRSSTAAVGGSRRGSAFSASAAFGSASRRGSALSLRGSIKAMATRRRSSAAAARRRSSTAAAQRRRSSAVSINLQDVFNENNAGNDNDNAGNVVGSHHSDSKRRSFNGSLRDMAKKAVEVAKMCSRRTSSCSGADASDLFDEDEYYDSLLPDNSNDHRHSHRYALKQLSSETWWGNASALKNGAADLVLEAAYLSALQTPGHPGLIKLHGLSEGGCAALESSCPSRALETTTVTKNGIVEPSSFGNNGVHPPPAPFFLILDRLDCALDEKIHSQWSARGRGGDNATRSGGLGRRATSLRNLRKMAGHHHHHHDGGRSAAAMALEDAAALAASDDDPSASLAERLSVARDVASALAYLHGRRMLHRDVKPDNIGFDMQGNVKIFDLGLAKELKPSQAVDGDGRSAGDDGDETLYKLTGRTGSRTYMAPEVSLSLPYGLSADVYSFSVMLWELCALRRPYEGLSADEHDAAVVRGYVRPDSPELQAATRGGSSSRDEEEESLWSDDLRFLMGSGWDADCRMRPSMEEVRDALRAEVLNLGGTLSKAAEMEAEAAAKGGSTAASVGSGGGGARPSRALAA